MRITNFSQDFFRQITKLAGPLVLLFCIGTMATAQKEVIVHNFKRGTDGAFPESALIADKAGNLYGTTNQGGGSPNCVSGRYVAGCGVVFELTPPGNGVQHWTETILYAFQGGKLDGTNPIASLVFDATGNLYGTTNSDGQNNAGMIFKLSPPSSPGGAWTETVLYNFIGEQPTSGLVFDSQGNLYGESSVPEVYELSAPSAPGGSWTLMNLHFFDTENGGTYPIGGLTLDQAGDLYGTSGTGGNGGRQGCPLNTCGLVFELVKPVTGNIWKEKVLYNFTGQNGDGASPYGGVVFHGGNNLYGTTQNGGNGINDGTVFELSAGSGSWTETTLYDFSSTAGHCPEAGVVFDHNGNLYSTLFYGLNGGGEVFELSPTTEAGSPWTFIDLYDSICGDDACNLTTNPIFDKSNVLYGATATGGTADFGVVFSVTP
jgi:uncharacterized repeat protein (TIGR03803 family)